MASAGIDAPPRFVEVTGSTNADLLQLAREGAPDWTVVVAGHQTGGRGRLGRSWVSEPGASLLASVLLRPEIRPERAPVLSLLAGVAMVGALSEACGVETRCKWPNDLVVGDRKLGGILLEASMAGGTLEHAVVGVGVNLTQSVEDFPAELRKAATSVSIEGGLGDAEALLGRFLRELREELGGIDDGGVLERYRSLCETLGRTVRANGVDGREVEGSAADIGEAGELLVETEEGMVRVGFGEVLHLR